MIKLVILRQDKCECSKWAGLLLKAAKNAGVDQTDHGELTLDEHNASSYLEINGEALFVGNIVKNLVSAWYQNEMLVEQGTCKLVNSGED